MSSPIFTTAHITATAALCGLLALAAALAFLPRRDRVDQLAVGVLSFGATAVLRLAANMPQLNDDGIKEFSANDCLAPIATWVLLSVYADIRRPPDPAAFGRVRGIATLIALAVNVVTI